MTNATILSEEMAPPVTLRFRRDILQRLDAAARRRGVNRSAFIMFALTKYLDEGI